MHLAALVCMWCLVVPSNFIEKADPKGKDMLHQVLDTPMRMLVRKYPDLAEIVLDQCYKEKKNLGEGIFVDMTFEFIEDSFNYRYIGTTNLVACLRLRS